MRREPKSRASTIFAIPAYSVLTQGRAVFDDAQLVNSIEYATTGAQVGQRHLAAKVTPPRFYRKNVRGALAGEATALLPAGRSVGQPRRNHQY